jgi:hypothetical protein
MEKDPYKFEGHSFGPIRLKNYPWHICRNCGLVKLRNKLTQWCVKMGCNNEDHLQYSNELRKVGKI